MRFVFSRLFFILLALGFLPLSLSWNFPALRYAVLIYDVALVSLALIDFFISRKLPETLTIKREFEKRFAIGDETNVRLHIENASPNSYQLKIKDEFPPELKLSETREAAFKIEAQTAADFIYGLTPPRRGKYQFGTTAVRFLSKIGLVWCQADLGAGETVKVYPNMRRARENGFESVGRGVVSRRSAQSGSARRRTRF